MYKTRTIQIQHNRVQAHQSVIPRRKRYRLRSPLRLCVVLLLVLACGGVCVGAGQALLLQYNQQPEFSFVREAPTQLDLTQLRSPDAIVLDVASGKVVGERNSAETIYPASLTKMMTALVMLEQTDDLDAQVTLSAQLFSPLVEQDASLAGFQSGETATMRDLLYGMLLPSGAECCVAAANAVAGSEESFVEMMNQKAAALGMTNTHFVNVTGLHDANQYSTVKDLATLLRAALQNDTFRAAFTAQRYSTEPSNRHPKGFTMRSTMFKQMNDTRVIDGEILGGKTGYTEQAGLCLASLANVNGTEYIAVTAKAEGNHNTAQWHILDAIAIYNQLGANRVTQ